jgi:hypothetical protein
VKAQAEAGAAGGHDKMITVELGALFKGEESCVDGEEVEEEVQTRFRFCPPFNYNRFTKTGSGQT